MAWTNVTAFLVNNSSVTIQYTGVQSANDIQFFAENIIKNSGIWITVGNPPQNQFIPATAIQSIVVS